MDKIAVPPGARVAGLTLQVVSVAAGGVHDKVTVPANPLTPVTLTVAVALLPRVTLRD